MEPTHQSLSRRSSARSKAPADLSDEHVQGYRLAQDTGGVHRRLFCAGHHEHRNATEMSLRSKVVQHSVPINAGQHQVQNDQIRWRLIDTVQGADPVSCFVHGKPGKLQAGGIERAQIRVILDDQDEGA